MLHLIFDTETSGLPKNWSAPLTDSENWPRLVSISWIISDGEVHEEFDFIIKPVGFEIPAAVSAIHGITQERALAEGHDLKEILDKFYAAVSSADKVIAHNIRFDRAIVGAEFYRLGQGEIFDELIRSKERVCTMMDFMKKYGFSKWPKLMELHQKLFGEGFDGAHNSLADTKACMKCYFEIIK